MSLNPIDALSEGVQKGLDAFAIGIGDDMLNMSSSGGMTNNTYEGKLLVDIATFTYNPFRDPTVINTLEHSALLYVVFLLMFLLIGGAYVVLSRLKPSRELLGYKIERGFSLSEFSMLIFALVVLVPFVPFLMWCVLLLSHIISKSIMTGILPSIMPTPENVGLYVAMCSMYPLMSGAFIWRSIVIGIVVGYCFAMIVLLAIPYTRRLGVGLFLYFVIMAFMQPAILATTCIGVGIIQHIAPVQSPHEWQMFCYLILTIFLFVVALIFILGPITIMKLLGSAKNKIKLVL